MNNVFGKNLGVIQKLRGISNGTLAKKMDVSPMTISLHRNGAHSPSLRTITKYADALGVRPAVLIDSELLVKLGKEIENG